MKLFTQLALVTAMAASGSAFALQSLDDAALGDTTGQDGITVLIGLPSNTLTIQQIALFDKGGYSGAQESGALTFGQTGPLATAPVGTAFSLATSGPIGLVIDSSGGGASGVTTGLKPVLNILVNLPTMMNIVTGDISVQGANTSVAGAYTVDTNNASKILNSMTIGLGGATLNIQLGTPNQGALAVANATITGGLSISGFGVTDNTYTAANPTYSGTLSVGTITLKSNTLANLNLGASVDLLTTAGVNSTSGLGTTTGATAGALMITMGTATNTANYDVYMQGITLGDAASTLGDVKLTGLNLTGAKIAISGH